jgi:hypothetical protein
VTSWSLSESKKNRRFLGRSVGLLESTQAKHNAPEFVRGRWCDIVLNVRAPTEDKSDYVKDRFYEELEQIFDKFPNYHTKILPKSVRKTFSNQQLGMRVCTKLVTIMELE